MHIIITMLRQTPEDSPHFEDDRFHYYRGLVDVAALLLINVESPSLASIVLCQLATFHLRDASRTPSMLEPAIRAILPPLLHHLDPILYQALSLDAIMVDTLCPWIQSWFSNTMSDLRLQSRLADVFLATHAVMPMYVYLLQEQWLYMYIHICVSYVYIYIMSFIGKSHRSVLVFTATFVPPFWSIIEQNF